MQEMTTLGRAVHRLRAWPVRLVIAGITVGAMALVAGVLITLSWFGSRQMLLEAAALSARDVGQVAAERSRRMVEPGTATLRTLAFDPLVSAIRLDDRLARRHVLMNELIANPLLSAIYVGYESGDFLLARPLDRRDIRQRFDAPRQANYVIQTVTRSPGAPPEGRYFFYDAKHDLVAQREAPDYTLDPRERPWYRAASETVSPITSGPYLFFTTRQIGISLSRLASTGQAIVGVDVALEDLGDGLSDLRMTPSAELALIDPTGSVIAYRDPQALLGTATEAGGDGILPLEALGVKSLTQLQRIARKDRVVSYQVDGHEWLGMALPFRGVNGLDLQLLVAAPAEELLGDLAQNRNRMILIAASLIALVMPLGWQAGSMVGEALERTTAQAQRMSRFDFRRPPARAAFLREVGMLNGVMDDVGKTVEAFLSISRLLGAEPRMDTMLVRVLEEAVNATRCLGGAVYLPGEDGATLVRAARFGEQGSLQDMRPAAPPAEPMVVVEPAPAAARTTRELPDQPRPPTQIELELRGRRGQLEGLLVLVHKPDSDHASPEFLAFTRRLTGMLAVALETRQLIEAQRKLFDAVIRVLADAIDAKSAYTGGHCERVPHLAMALADRMSADTTGPYADFRLDEDERYAFYLAAWLHDCGKVTSAEHIVDKATKLEVIYNRIHEIRMRFEVLWRDAEIDCLRARLDGADPAEAEALRDATHARLQEDFRFVAECNVGGEFLADEAVQRLQRIAAATWLRHFDDALGLAVEERRRLEATRSEPVPLPATERLLADRPEHRVPWGDTRRPPVERDDPHNTFGFDMKLPAWRQDMGELHNLSIRRGTLTDEDRFAINDHIVQTLVMLRKLPWPRHLERVPDIAANHHEKMDGTGYPRRLPAESLATTDRIMALADVFEALTAADRPYKTAKTLSESLRIMAFMCKDRHLDAGLFAYFLRSGVWKDYAGSFLRPAQVDEVDVEALVRLACGTPAA